MKGRAAQTFFIHFFTICAGFTFCRNYYMSSYIAKGKREKNKLLYFRGKCVQLISVYTSVIT